MASTVTHEAKALRWIAVIVLVVWLLGFVLRSADTGGRKGRRRACGLAMRTDKLALAYEVALHWAAILIWSRSTQ